MIEIVVYDDPSNLASDRSQDNDRGEYPDATEDNSDSSDDFDTVDLASVGGVDWDCLDDSRRSRRMHVADAGNPAGWAADHGESLECEGRPGAVSEQVFKERYRCCRGMFAGLRKLFGRCGTLFGIGRGELFAQARDVRNGGIAHHRTSDGYGVPCELQQPATAPRPSRAPSRSADRHFHRPRPASP